MSTGNQRKFSIHHRAGKSEVQGFGNVPIQSQASALVHNLQHVIRPILPWLRMWSMSLERSLLCNQARESLAVRSQIPRTPKGILVKPHGRGIHKQVRHYYRNLPADRLACREAHQFLPLQRGGRFPYSGVHRETQHHFRTHSGSMGDRYLWVFGQVGPGLV